MTDSATLRLIDTHTGELVEPDCPRCRDVDVEDVANLEAENRRLLRRVKKLERDRAREREEYPERQKVIEVIERWKRHTDHPRSNANSADRFDLVLARLREGYSWDDLELAIDGIGAFRYVVQGQRTRTGTTGQRHDRMGICCGSGEAIERFANLGHEARKELEADAIHHRNGGPA